MNNLIVVSLAIVYHIHLSITFGHMTHFLMSNQSIKINLFFLFFFSEKEIDLFVDNNNSKYKRFIQRAKQKENMGSGGASDHLN